MSLLALPFELLLRLPEYLHNIEDFTNVSSTCVTLREAFSNTSPNQILRLAAASRRIFFRPDPHFLIAATARQVSEWALQSRENTAVLQQSLKGGVETLLELCLEKAGLTLQEIRRLHALRFSTLNPVADLIDRAAGLQWNSTPDFWDGGVSDAVTIDCEPTRAMYQIIIYGELFASTIDANLQPQRNLPKFDVHVRLDYIRYCIPDCICARGSSGFPPPDLTGPYHPDLLHELPVDQVAMQFLLTTRKWMGAFRAARSEVVEDFGMNEWWERTSERDLNATGGENWKQRLWGSVIQSQGFLSMEMMQPGGAEKSRSRLVELRGWIEALEEMPKVHTFGRCQNPASECPDLYQEVFVCMACYWQFGGG